MITIDETNYTGIIQHLTPGTKFRVIGYQSSSGEIRDYDLIYLGRDGYKEMVRESLESLGKLRKEMPQLFDTPVAFQASKELEESFQATLNGTQTARHWNPNPDDKSVRLFNMKILSSTQIAPASEPKKATKSSEKTIRKAAIRKLLPINDYLGQLALLPGKFKTVEIKA